ncbi:IQ motif-containing protein H [Oryzias melastigma]|nr:IQ motif-containing protein H [Oryzias melastigma]
MGQKESNKGTDIPFPESSQTKPPVNKHLFKILRGRVDPKAADFCHFRESFCLCWDSVGDVLEALQKLLRDFAVPSADVHGERLVELCHCWENSWTKTPSAATLLSALDNQKEVLDLVSRPGQRYRGEGGAEAAAVRIQSSWRSYLARRAHLYHCRRKWAAGIIAVSWLLYTQRQHVRKALQAKRSRQLENNRSRAQHLAANWKHIQSSKRTIIHIPSLGYSQKQRLNLRRFDVLQNTQIGRLCEVRDENVEVIYICPQHLGEDILDYYTNFLKCDGDTDGAGTGTGPASSRQGRFVILTPEAVDYFPNHKMCLSTLLKYSPLTLKRVRGLIEGRQAYIVGGVAHVDDLAVADELNVPILGPEPAVSRLCNSKSEGRRIFAAAEVDVPPGQGDVYSLSQLHEVLAKLIVQNIPVRRWLFKMNSHYGRSDGTAYCDVYHLSCFTWALQQYELYSPDLWKSESIQESVMSKLLDEIPHWLAHHAQPARSSCYPSWTCFLKTFLRQGGTVEAHPPSESITFLTVDLLLEPGGGVSVLSCGDQLYGSCQLEAVGSAVPQTSVQPETLHSFCIRVGRACQHYFSAGYVSVGLATFTDLNTTEQKVWAVDLSVAYSNQLSMTQTLLMMTGGTADWRTGCLEAPVLKIENQPQVENCHAVIGSHLFHSNLSVLYCDVFFNMCKLRGIGFDMKSKQGTVFVPYNCRERCSIGMITVSKDLELALMTFAQNLSVIHQEISSSKLQRETNFKEVVDNIEKLLQTKKKSKDKDAV